jgi:transcriptional regulator with XRE-family HTH domain
MAREALTGSRIREKRIMAGMKQADLARSIGISASYLNLIEHNRRKIGGKLLLGIAAVLEVEPQTLTEGAEATLIATLREAAEQVSVTNAETLRVDEFAGRFPGWAEVLSRTRARVLELEETVDALNDRLSHDPQLAASLHELLSTATAIRSTAAILTETETLKPEWRDRFQTNIHEDSRRLSDSAQSLLTYFDAASHAQQNAASPQEDMEAFVVRHDYHFAGLERSTDADADIEDILSAASFQSHAAGHLVQTVLREVASDAGLLSLDTLRAEIDRIGPDPLGLLQVLDISPAVLLRRLAALPELGAGLIVGDRLGNVSFRKRIEGFSIPRQSAFDPLAPLFRALGQPGAIVTEPMGAFGRAQTLFTGVATCDIAPPQAYNAQPVTQGVMLLMPEVE